MDSESFLNFVRENRVLQILYIVFICAYLANMLLGNRQNRAISQKCADILEPVLSGHFSQLTAPAMDSPSPTRPKFQVENGSNSFSHFASGRKHVATWTSLLTLHARQDLLVGRVAGWCFGDDFDRLEVHLVLGNGSQEQGGGQGGFIYAICPQKLASRFKQARYDLKTFTRTVPRTLPPTGIKSSGPGLSSLGEEFCLLADNCGLEIADLVFTETVMKGIGFLGSRLESLLISDQPHAQPEEFPPPPCAKVVECIVRLPKDSAELEEFLKVVTLWILAVADVVSCVQVPREALVKSFKQRQSALELISKSVSKKQQAEAEKKRIERAAAKKEDLENMTREQRRKYEEKEQKKLKQRSTKILRS